VTPNDATHARNTQTRRQAKEVARNRRSKHATPHTLETRQPGARGGGSNHHHHRVGDYSLTYHAHVSDMDRMKLLVSLWWCEQVMSKFAERRSGLFTCRSLRKFLLSDAFRPEQQGRYYIALSLAEAEVGG
jgi:hypothetical protein